MLSEMVLSEVKATEDITVECFPNKSRARAGKYGQKIKLPYGVHLRTGDRSYFIGNDGEPLLNVDLLLDSIAKASPTDVKRVLATNTGEEEATGEIKKELDTDLTPLGDLDNSVKEVLSHCNLMRYLCLKSVKTGYLSHFERLSILHVFGHLGEEGKEFVHQVMKFTLNYKHEVTQRFINKIPQKPISCVKLRDQYKTQTAEFGCSCSFTRAKNCYPSPVLHAITSADVVSKDVTVPTSRTLTKTKAEKVKSDINVYSQAQELAKKILELKKQKRSLDRSVAKIEKELGRIFDDCKTDSMEIEMGLLIRRKNGEEYEWVIEI